MQIYMRRYGASAGSGGSDICMVGFPCPQEGIINQVKGEVHVWAALEVDASYPLFYGFEGWFVNTDDEATDFGNIQTLWDSAVPKADSVQNIDEGWTQDTDAAEEIGAISFAQVFDQEIGMPEKVFEREAMMTVCKAFGYYASGTPDKTVPTDMFNVNIRKKYKALQNMGLLFGFSQPDYLSDTEDDDLIDSATAGVVDFMYILKYLDTFIDKALVELISLTEAGATTPYDEILNFLGNTLEKVNVGDNFPASTVSLNCAVRMTAGLWVPGQFSHQSIGPE